MLIRILAENPGHTFTRNIDGKFVSTVKDLLREGRDMSAQHMLRETLDMFEAQNSWDEDLAGLLAMWKKEKTRAAKYGGGQGQSVSIISPEKGVRTVILMIVAILAEPPTSTTL